MALLLSLEWGAKAAPDFNGLGFKAYLAGDYPKALGLFDRARKETPEEAYGWFNWARTTAIINAKVDPPACDRADDWRYLALASLEKSLEIDRAKILPKLDEAGNKLDEFKATRPYVRWWAAQQPVPVAKTELRDLITGSEWIRYEGTMLVWIDFSKDGQVTETHAQGGAVPKKAGSWSAKGTDLVVTGPDKKVRTFGVGKQKEYFDEGQLYITELQLSEEPAGKNWLLGPVDSDCGP
jgi:hypothetical protein